jgi:hypothetical protein
MQELKVKLSIDRSLIPWSLEERKIKMRHYFYG